MDIDLQSMVSGLPNFAGYTIAVYVLYSALKRSFETIENQQETMKEMMNEVIKCYQLTKLE